MASVRLRADNSIWLARFVDAAGKKREVSTGTANRREAQKIADAYEATAQRKMTVAHVQRTLRDLLADASGTPLPGSTLSEFFGRCLEQLALESALSTARYHATASRHFLRWVSSNLPHQGRTELSAVTATQINAYRVFRLTEVSSTTVNQDVKFLRHVFEMAKREGVIIESPLASISKLPDDREAVEIRPFTMDEVKVLLAAADEEWRSMILFGLYTGQRLGDLATLDWKRVNMERFELAFRTSKTKKQMHLPLSKELVALLAAVPVLERLGPVHPRLCALRLAAKKSAPLSAEFHSLLVRTGIVKPRPHHVRRNEPGSSRHRREEVSFHALRHTCTSLLRDAGAPVGVAMELIGHCSRAVHEHYSHLGSDTLRRGISLLPSL